MCVRAPRILAMAIIWGQRLFRSELPIAWLLFEGGDYSRWCLIKEILYIVSLPALWWKCKLTAPWYCTYKTECETSVQNCTYRMTMERFWKPSTLTETDKPGPIPVVWPVWLWLYGLREKMRLNYKIIISFSLGTSKVTKPSPGFLWSFGYPKAPQED